ncbi:FAD-binding oxidoreductase [Oceaniglobus ichthyenteri]|uniref:FAD-binding oxidoreductase n=1 Tax=Oceaniglobus ichthyenteri TaxID=2136177 RepID=UPI000D34B563|nr:FAD-binding oxidoreductase [Oceaniglobus ichthyenteri]
MEILDALRAITGPAHVLTGADCGPWAQDWTGNYKGAPLAVVRPANTDEVSRIMALAHDTGTPVVPVSGNTGLAGGAHAPGQLVLSIDRLRKIREIRPAARTAIVEAGVILSAVHGAVAEHGLVFPVTFGARGSALIGGVLATNAGGSNVLRFGNTREQVLGIEVVLPTGEILNLMSELRKDNSGFDLRDLFIGAEGTLGIITAAVLKLQPMPAAYATAMVALSSLGDALTLLNRLQAATGGAVEAFEYMPASYIDRHLILRPEARAPFDERYDVNVMIEVGATAARDAIPGEDGAIPIVTLLEQTLGDMIEDGAVLDAVVARTEAQRAEIWARREDAGAMSVMHLPTVITDVALPLDRVETFLTRAHAAFHAIDPNGDQVVVAHLGDGNVHLTLWPSPAAANQTDQIIERIEDVVADLGGSFSAEHGIGLSKRNTMARRKDPVALDVMQRIKAALDPAGIMNPGKVLP